MIDYIQQQAAEVTERYLLRLWSDALTIYSFNRVQPADPILSQFPPLSNTCQLKRGPYLQSTGNAGLSITSGCTTGPTYQYDTDRYFLPRRCPFPTQ